MKGFLVIVLLVLHCALVHSAGQKRFIFHRITAKNELKLSGSNEPRLVSDGVHESTLTTFDGSVMDQSRTLGTELESVGSNSTESVCEQTYGVLPCTKSIIGNLFLLVVYGFFMYQSASFLSTGSEHLLTVMGPGIVGGLFLPILGALPDALLILVSGISGSKETAQQQVVIGMGLLAGSTVMLLTALWGSCLVVGKCDLSGEMVAIDSQDTRGFSLYGSGITTDKSTSKASQIMVATILPFIIVQIPQVFHLKSGKRTAELIAFIVAILSLLSYCVFQVLQPWVQKRRIAFLKHRHFISVILKDMHQRHFGRLIRDDGEPDVEIIQKIFNDLDEDKDGYLSKGELRGLIVGLELNEMDNQIWEAVDKVMSELDVETDNRLTKEEFKNGMCKWISVATSTVGHSDGNSSKITSDFHMKSKEELDALMDDTEEHHVDVDNPFRVYLKAGLLMLGGAVVAGIFADPLVDAVDNFSEATNIPSFFISFIAMPLATNSSEAISAVIFASRKRRQTASLTYSEIYGGVTMNNTLCLGVFLAIVYLRGLDWNFSAEVLVILLVVLVMGLLGSFRTTFHLWMSSIAFLLYPLTLVIVYVLDFILGWS